MRTLRWIGSALLPLALLTAVPTLVGCEEEDEYVPQQSKPTVNLSRPTLDRDLTTTTHSEVTFRPRFTNGGDENVNMDCTVHWTTYSTKPKTDPKTSDMTRHESMDYYDGHKTKTTFSKAHTGLSGGTYVYYYFECSNSKYTTKSSVSYKIVKRQ